MRVPAALALLALVALLPPAAAHAESEAPELRDDVAATWHEPASPPPHTQWHAFLELRPDANVTAVHYQVCRVGQACFAPPTPAGRLANGTFSLDTAGYLANGRPVDYQAGWRLGVKWFLDGQEFPAGPDLSSPECAGDAAMACSERHYFVFTMGGDGRKPAASPGLPLVVGLLAVAACWTRRHGPAGP